MGNQHKEEHAMTGPSQGEWNKKVISHGVGSPGLQAEKNSTL